MIYLIGLCVVGAIVWKFGGDRRKKLNGRRGRTQDVRPWRRHRMHQVAQNIREKKFGI